MKLFRKQKQEETIPEIEYVEVDSVDVNSNTTVYFTKEEVFLQNSGGIIYVDRNKNKICVGSDRNYILLGE